MELELNMVDMSRCGSFRIRVNTSIPILDLEYFPQEVVHNAVLYLILACRLSSVGFLVFDY